MRVLWLLIFTLLIIPIKSEIVKWVYILIYFEKIIKVEIPTIYLIRYTIVYLYERIHLLPFKKQTYTFNLSMMRIYRLMSTIKIPMHEREN